MTVGELIEKLSALDPDLRVFSKGYEGGYDDATLWGERLLTLDVNSAWYYGPHEESEYTKAEGEKVLGVVIS